MLHRRPRVAPAVIDLQALRAWAGNAEIIIHNLSGSHAGLPLHEFFLYLINREYQTLHTLRLSLRDRSPHLIFLPSHLPNSSLLVLHSQLSVLNSSLPHLLPEFGDFSILHPLRCEIFFQLGFQPRIQFGQGIQVELVGGNLGSFGQRDQVPPQL